MNMNISEALLQDLAPDKAATPKKRVVSLFCGAGGLDIGFRKAGFKAEFAADYDQAAVKTYNANHRGNKAEVIDLFETSAEEVYRRATRRLKNNYEIDGIIGGPPCQGFSRANTARCHSDPRNLLALKYAEIVNAFFIRSRIKFFVFENVPEIKAAKNTEFLKLLRDSLSVHFNIYERELDAWNYGVPQVRKRYFIVGINKEIDGGGYKFPPVKRGKKKVVSDAILGLPNATFFRSDLGPADIPFHPNHWTMQPRSKKFLTGEMPAGGRSFIKLDWGKPSRTVAYGNREIHIHPDGTRRVTIYEAMRLQGFPLNYELVGNLSEQVKQVSNAVPPPLAAALARSIKKIS